MGDGDSKKPMKGTSFIQWRRVLTGLFRRYTRVYTPYRPMLTCQFSKWSIPTGARAYVHLYFCRKKGVYSPSYFNNAPLSIDIKYVFVRNAVWPFARYTENQKKFVSGHVLGRAENDFPV